MDRRACVDLPALALQLLLRAHPDWKTLPAAVVDADDPGGKLLWLNERAWRMRLRPGMRYASALALDGRLRAGVVAGSEIATAQASILEMLRLHTPHVEMAGSSEPGVFWLDANGLESLYTSVDAWAHKVARTLAAGGFDARVAVGATRFGTYALAKTLTRRVLVCESIDEERRRTRGVALERIDIDPVLVGKLARLGVRTVGDFLDLPPAGIRRRFGNDAWLLHRRARGEAWDPLVPLEVEEPLTRSLLLEDPVADSGLVLFLVRRLLVLLIERMAARAKAVSAVTITLHRSLRRDRPSLVFRVRAAEPTLDESVIVDLIRLRLESELRRELSASSIIEIEIEAEAAPAEAEQIRLFHDRTKRDLVAGSRAIARIRAEFGEASVVRAVLRQGHLPEARFAWEAFEKLEAPSPRVVLDKPLVRRIEERSLALPPKPFRERDDCWIASPASGVRRVRSVDAERGDDRGADVVREGSGVVRDGDRFDDARDRPDVSHDRNGSSRARRASAQTPRRATNGHDTAHGRVENMAGPYIVSGGWWNRELHREYHYASTENGEILWVYYDRQRRRWFLAGKVE